MIALKIQEFLTERLGPDGVKHAFYLSQVGVGAIFVGTLWLFRSRNPDSGFAVREADRLKALKEKKLSIKRGPELASARIEKKTPLQLSGIRIDGPPHEILGVLPSATSEEVQRAYREKMKQYHPDKVGRPGTREWIDAQKLAEAINRAKDEMLKRIRPN